MPTPNLLTPAALGPIKNQDAGRVCSLANISSAGKKLVTWRELKRGLDMSISELESQRSKEQIVNKALLVARFTKATCDAFIEMAAEMTKVVLPKAAAKKVKLVNTVYGMATPLAKAGGTMLAGGKVDKVKTMTAVTKAAAGLVKNSGVEILIKNTAVKVEIVKGAMNGDQKGLFKSAVDYVYDLNTIAIKIAGAEKTAAFANIAKQTFDYNSALQEAFDEYLDLKVESADRHTSLKVSMLRSARQISMKITELEAFIQSCQTSAPDAPVTVSPPR